jgi:adenylate cyclase class IV
MKNLYLLLSMLWAFELAAQTPHQHKAKSYIDSTQTYYQQVSLPVYIFVSNSPDKADASLLKQDGDVKPEPFYLDGHGKHYFRHKDHLEHTESLFEVNADGLAPSSELLFSNVPSYQSNGTLFYGPRLQLSLKARDQMSGVEASYVSINQGEYMPYQKPHLFDQEGAYTLSYYSVDRVGNAEKPLNKKFKIDATSPLSQLSVEGEQAAEFVSAQTQLLLKAEDDGVGLKGIYYSIDDGKEQKYNTPIRLNSLADGAHVLRYFAEDMVQNREGSREYHFVIDRKAPLVQKEIIGKSYQVNGKTYYAGETKMKLTATDEASGVQDIYYAINGGNYVKYEDAFVISREEKKVTVRAYAVDRVNNKSLQNENSIENKALVEGTMDFTGPEISFLLAGPVFQSRDSLFISAATRISLEGKDEGSGLSAITYAIDGGEVQDYAEAFNLHEGGVHHVTFQGYDYLLNKSEEVFTVITDVQGPEIFPRLSIAAIGLTEVEGVELSVYPKHVALFLSATDQLTGFDQIYYSINGGAEQEYKGVIRGFKEGETLKVKIRATDLLGNELQNEIAFAIEGKGLTMVRR